jgi:hypothetical protein
VAALQIQIVSSTRASIAVEMPPLRAEMPEKREESPPACLTAQRIQSLACCREHGRRVAAVIPPLSGSGGGRGEAIRNIYYSDRQLPPGHDPGADSGEAPTAGSVAHGH